MEPIVLIHGYGAESKTASAGAHSTNVIFHRMIPPEAQK